MVNASVQLSEAAKMPAIKRSSMTYNSLLAIYAIIILIPWALSFIEGLEIRGWYEELVVLLSLGGMSMMFCQFILLNGRVDLVSDRIGVDNAMKVHDKSGQYLAILFFLHPFMIAAPRILVAPSFALEDLWIMFTSPEASTGLYAWSMLIIFSLMAIFKNRIGLSYEAWRYTHSLGFVAVIILATHHAVTVGRHGRYNAWFDAFWIILCVLAVGIVLYIYFIRPRITARKPFKVVDCHKGSADDWYLTVEKDGDFPFDFDAGQFTWISTSETTFKRTEHPFSIATSPAALPKISYVIRQLGDYTSQLDKLKPGQRVWVDGPHGVFTLNARNATGIALIAGGAGIGPIIGILRQLKHSEDKRPIRLVYGNRTIEQMMFIDELDALNNALNFDYTLVLNNPPENFAGHKGFIDKEVLGQLTEPPDYESWDYYICGPKSMVVATEEVLKTLNIPSERVLYEQLGF